MTTMSTTAISSSLQARRLPVWAIAGSAIAGIGLALLLFTVLKVLGGGLVLTIVGAVLLFLAVLAIASIMVEGGRAARNRIATALIYSAFVLALLPLISVVV